LTLGSHPCQSLRRGLPLLGSQSIAEALAEVDAAYWHGSGPYAPRRATWCRPWLITVPVSSYNSYCIALPRK
jgi:hypothetical protein